MLWGHGGLAVPRKVSLILAVIKHEAGPFLSLSFLTFWSLAQEPKVLDEAVMFHQFLSRIPGHVL
jgi:hypothetical protein